MTINKALIQAGLSAVSIGHERIVQGTTCGVRRTLRASPIPKGLCPPAQGCEARATLGVGAEEIDNPNGVAATGRGEHGRNPVGVGIVNTLFSQGSSFLATLGFGAESRWDSLALPPIPKIRFTAFPLLLATLLALAPAASAKDYFVHTFKKTQLTDKFWCEGATLGDLNHDGIPDLISGPFWYEGPGFKKAHQYYPATHTFKHKKADGSMETIEGFEGALGVTNTYSDNFFAFVHDFNKDGWNDILIIGFPGEQTAWYENPKGGARSWQKHVVLDQTDNESPTFTDLTGDGKPELVCCSKGFYGYAEPDWSEPAKPWRFHHISPDNKYGKFTHGMGVGDVNGDGRLDVLEKDGWWEQPASLEGDPVWTFHKFAFAQGGAQMYAYDVNGDGLNDVITSFAAHGYGLVWYEQVRNDGEITFKQHVILSTEQKPLPDKYGVTFSEIHALDLVDMNGDGLKDIVTGNRYWSHGRHGSAGPTAKAVLYWFELVRNPDKTAEFIPHLIDDDSGVGTQVVAVPRKDGHPDIVVGNKKGTFFFEHEVKKANQAEWEKAQPKLLP